MFPAHRAHHQERQIVSIQPLVAVTLCRWPCRVQVGSISLNTSYYVSRVQFSSRLEHAATIKYVTNSSFVCQYSDTFFMWDIPVCGEYETGTINRQSHTK